MNEIGAEMPGLEDLCVFSCLRLSDRGLVGLGSLESRLRRFCWAGAYKVGAAPGAPLYVVWRVRTVRVPPYDHELG